MCILKLLMDHLPTDFGHLSSDLCPLSSIIWTLTPETLRIVIPQGCLF